MHQALVADAARRSRVWLVATRYDGELAVRDRLVWHVWHEGALVVVSGPAGNSLPGIERAGSVDGTVDGTVDVTLRSRDTGGRLVTWQATVHVVESGTEEWEGHAAALLGVRLNLPDPAETRRAWAARGTIVRLGPPLP